MCVNDRGPLFFSHQGFINEAFKQSIVKNIKTKNSQEAQAPSVSQ
jgi:hypothetical protein